jgi:pyruvate dehydrogenase E1 component alpha subunit
MIHAVGLGWAERLGGSDRVAITYYGDGATSEGDFHEAMNFAGVYRTPTVFVCQNNGWAISMSLARQTASDTIAQKAGAYGMPGVLVDGNDLLRSPATRGVIKRREGAPHRGDHPRMGAHTLPTTPGAIAMTSRSRAGVGATRWIGCAVIFRGLGRGRSTGETR